MDFLCCLLGIDIPMMIGGFIHTVCWGYLALFHVAATRVQRDRRSGPDYWCYMPDQLCSR